MEPYEIAATIFGAAMLTITTRELLHRRMRLSEYSFWAIIWSALILFGTIPQFYSALLLATQVLGMYTPIHFVTTFSILILLVVAYRLGKKIAELDDKLSTVVQHIALRSAGAETAAPKEKPSETEELDVRLLGKDIQRPSDLPQNQRHN